MTSRRSLRRREAMLGLAGTLMLAGCASGVPKTLGRLTSGTFELVTGDGRKLEVVTREPVGRVIGQIAFSHGWGGSPEGCLRIIEPLASAGWRVLAPLHTDANRHPDKATFRTEASWGQRMQDMRTLSQHLGDRSYVAAGHSYGALTALVLGGVEAQIPQGIVPPLRDPKVVASIAFSPPLPLENFVGRDDFAKLAVPALIQTGTCDDPTFEGVNDQTWQGRLAAYEAPAPGNNRYGLVLEGVDHNFGGGIGARLGQPDPLQDRQLDIAVEIAGLFARAFGLGEQPAKASLNRRISDAYPVRLTRR